MSFILKFIEKDPDNFLYLLGIIVAFLGLSCFAVYRLLSGEIGIGLLDSILAILLSLFFFQALREKPGHRQHLLFVILFMGAFYIALILKGAEILYWAYPIIASSYFLLSLRAAVPLNLAFIIGLMPLMYMQISVIEMISASATQIILGVIGYIFSARSENQKNQLAVLSNEDALTKVQNRRSLELKLDDIVACYSRFSQPVSLLILDLDFFKKINDTYGHAKGDMILVNFARTINSTIRVSDNLYRFGGEEFVIVASNTSLENAGKLAEYIRTIIQDEPLLKRYDIAASIGVSELTDYDDKESWLKRGDEALYEAKAGGRNTVYLARPVLKTNRYKYEKFSNDLIQIKYIEREAKTAMSTKAFHDGVVSKHKERVCFSQESRY